MTCPFLDLCAFIMQFQYLVNFCVIEQALNCPNNQSRSFSTLNFQLYVSTFDQSFWCRGNNQSHFHVPSAISTAGTEANASASLTSPALHPYFWTIGSCADVLPPLPPSCSYECLRIISRAACVQSRDVLATSTTPTKFNGAPVCSSNFARIRRFACAMLTIRKAARRAKANHLGHRVG